MRSGTPLTGPSGQLLDAVLEACGSPREQVYATNLLCWWKNAPTIEEIYECWPRLRDELFELKPKLIIPLGEIATDFLLGILPAGLKHTPSDWKAFAESNRDKWVDGEQYFGYGSRRGRTTWSTHLNAYVMPCPHPAGILHGGGSLINDVVRALSKIGLVINEFKPNGRESAYTFNAVTEDDNAQRVLGSLVHGRSEGNPGVALDIETNYGRADIDWFSEDLLCLSLTWGWDGCTAVIPGAVAKRLDWSVTANHGEPTNNCPNRGCPGVWWIGQNFIFDVGGIKRWIGVDLKIHEDTMFESYALDERPGYHDLERLGGEWCAAPMWKSELAKYTVTRAVTKVDKFGHEELKKDGTPKLTRKKFREVPDDALWRYNAGDTTYTYRSNIRQQRAVHEDGMDRVYRELLIPAANAFREIQYRGVYIDQHRQSELTVDWCEMWLEQLDALSEVVHREDPTLPAERELNYRSSQQMARFLYDVLKLPKQYKKPSTRGKLEAPKITTDKDALEVLYDYHPFCQMLHDVRQTAHQISVSEGIRERIKIDDMLHAVPQIHGTETGRLSYKDPNLQNISQDWMVGANLARIREIFAPRNPDTHFIAEADYKQIELWMAQKWSDDINMLTDLETGDFHRMTAMGVYNKKWDEVTKGDRFFTKMVTFGRLYERGAEDLTRGKSSLHCSIPEAEEWIRRWSERYSGYVQWADKLKKQAARDGIIESPWGRKRRYYLVTGQEAHHQLRSALNFCMQSTGHDYTLTALIELQKRLWEYDTYILIEGHDAIMFEMSKAFWQPAMALITETMQSVRPNSDWPLLTVEWKTGPNWGKCKEECKVCHKFYPEVGLPQEVAVSATVTQLRCPEHLTTGLVPAEAIAA